MFKRLVRLEMLLLLFVAAGVAGAAFAAGRASERARV
jgi:hypothetical protein